MGSINQLSMVPVIAALALTAVVVPAQAQTIVAENEDGFVVDSTLGMFSFGSKSAQQNANRKGWTLTIETAKRKGCTHLAQIGTLYKTEDAHRAIRGSLSPSRYNASFEWKRPNGAYVQVHTNPVGMADVFYIAPRAFMCAKEQPTTAAQFFMTIEQVEKELHFQELID